MRPIGMCRGSARGRQSHPPKQATLLLLAVSWKLPGAPAFEVRKVMSLPTRGQGVSGGWGAGCRG